ncbi:tetratricopeptide repeat protein [Pseudooctadecabacter jejudonensis]|uniref:Tetratricopeptide repeat protein n=1 Tax=Pseudooctadecabacter jejudonensis TaxID=1391910 RepID=A0A1Y5RTE3_9RHOB|nr:tetratricopeptide repeat protein [Pseudooctadecabacter jejudonensis]SLN22301.1 Tetratricopeptide repeat protein [Pseudooctadecabacter jejudonensis]
MGIERHYINSIATTLLITVGFSTPVWAQSERLDLLFEQLLEAESDEVERIEGQIITEWSKSGSAAMDLLLRRGEDAIEAGEFGQAVEHLTALVDHAPDFAEGYHGRATAYYNLGLYGPAIDDLRQTLVIEPRHFGAMIGVAVILEELDRVEEALEVWQKVAELSPADAEVEQVIERLNASLSGQTL